MNDVNSEFVIGIFTDEKATIAHECTHLAMWILRECHINPMESDGETMAHLVTYLFQEIEKRQSNENTNQN